MGCGQSTTKSAFLLLSLCLTPALSSPLQSCKVIPSDSNWPSAAEWKQLNDTVDGNLIIPIAPGSYCRTSSPHYDMKACSLIRDSWADSDWHAQNPVSIDYNDDACPVLNVTAECSTVSYPSYVVNATAPKYFQAAVNFARENNIRLNIKGTGHDWNGRSGQPSGLSIWTRHLNGLELDMGNAEAVKYGGVGALKIYAGMRWHEIYQYAFQHNVTAIGGGDGRVGVGGWIMGAGHGPLTSQFGLGADQVISMDFVTADGQLRTINETSDSDLFWAVRGGGVGFGAMVSVTVKVYESVSLGSYLFSWNTTQNSETFWNMATYLHSKIPDLMEAGLMGYYYPEINYHTNGNTHAPPYSTIWGVFLGPNMSTADVEKLLDPIETVLNGTDSRFPDGINVTHMYSLDHTFYDYAKGSAYGEVGESGRLGSRLLDRTALTGEFNRTKELLKQAFPKDSVTTGQMTTPVVAGTKEVVGGSNAVLPAWREAYVHLDIAGVWAKGGDAVDPAYKTQVADTLRNVHEAALVELATNTGAYMNEADPTIANWKETFYGVNYPRLLEIKQKYDPEGVFWCKPCVGQDLFNIVGGDGIGQDQARICRK